jgi:hydroxymethylbilane synthase
VKEIIRIGTRGSKLALWQAEFVAVGLKHKQFDTEIVPIETKGDKIQEVSIAKIGSKGVFTEEIEQQLAEGKIDIAVHSAKDLSSSLPPGFSILAFTEREKVNDVLVSHHGLRLSKEDLFVVGTSSTRRIAFLKHYFPKILTVAIRGNLQTRLRKMEEGHCDALLLAYAGVHRMGYNHLISQMMDENLMVPAVGQGSIAIEVYQNLDQKKKEVIRDVLNHQETETCLLAERAFLFRLEGGCSIPVFANAHLQNGLLRLTGGIISLDGKELIKMTETGSIKDPTQTGTRLANRILEAGGAKILKEIKSTL